MTQEDKRIAIAKACGWTFMGEPEYEDGALMGHHKVDGTEFLGWDMVPDYFNNLNACAEMEKALGWPETDDYAQNVKAVAAADIGLIPEHLSDFAWINARPSYRAEAFGITRSLWQEGE